MSKNIQEESFLRRKPQNTESAIQNSFGAPRSQSLFFEDGIDHKKRAKQLRNERKK
jgi:hypothetical protein